MEAVAMLFPLAFVGAIVTGVAMYRRGQAAALIATCEQDADVVTVELGLMGGVKAHLRRGAFECDVRATLPGKNTPGSWKTDVYPVGVAERTTLALSREGVFTGLASAIGFNDIQLGDPHLDDLFRIKGSDEDVVRALLLDDEVQTAAFAALGAGSAYGGPLRLGRDKVLTYRTRRSDYAYDTFRSRVDTMFDLAEALHNKRHIKPQRPAAPNKELPPRSGVGGASGAPLGVRVT